MQHSGSGTHIPASSSDQKIKDPSSSREVFFTKATASGGEREEKEKFPKSFSAPFFTSSNNSLGAPLVLHDSKGQADQKQLPRSVRNDPEHSIEDKKFHGYSKKAKASALTLAILSSYAGGCLSGAQIYEGLPIFFGIPTEGASLPIRMLVLPAIPFINSIGLYYGANLEAFNSSPSLVKASGRKCKKLPLECFVVFLTAATSGLIAVSSSKSLLSDISNESAKQLLLPITLGIAEALQYILLDGTSLLKRIKGGFSYQNDRYKEALKTYSTKKRYGIYAGVYSVPVLGAILSTALAFSEIRELAIELNSSNDEEYQIKLANLIAGPLSFIYGIMQAALYGYLSQQKIIDYFWPQNIIANHDNNETDKIRKLCRVAALISLAVVCALAQGMTMMTAAAESYEDMAGKLPDLVGLIIIGVIAGSAGALQNFWVEGAAMIEGHPHELETKPGGFHVSDRTTLYEVTNGVMRVALLTLMRTFMQSYLIPTPLAADDVNFQITLASYGFSSLACTLVWVGLLEVPRLLRMKPGYFHLNLLSEKASALSLPYQVDYQSDQSFNQSVGKRQEEARHSIQGSGDDEDLPSTFSTAVSEPPLFGLQNNSQENQLYTSMEIRSYFYRSIKRLTIQAILQLGLPMLMGAFLEKGLRQFFEDYTEQDANNSLKNAQLISALVTGLVSVSISSLMDRRWQKTIEKQLHGAMGEPEELEFQGYTLEEMHALLPQDEKSNVTIRQDILCFEEHSLDKREAKYHRGAQSDIFKRTTVEAEAGSIFYLRGISADGEIITNPVKSTIEQINKAFVQFEQSNKPIFLSVYCKTKGITEENGDFAFLVISIKKGQPTIVFYSPTNNTHLQYLMEKLTSRLNKVQLITNYTHTPISKVHSGAWVVEQLKDKVQNQHSDGNRSFGLLRKVDLIAARAEHVKSLDQMRADKAPPIERQEPRPRSNLCTYLTQSLSTCWARLQTRPPAVNSDEQESLTKGVEVNYGR